MFPRALTPALQAPARRAYAFRTRLFEASRPFSEWLGKSRSTPVEWQPQALRTLGQTLRPGMLLVGRRGGLGSNLFVPGYWKHAGIVVADDRGQPSRVVEATIRRGVAYRDIAEFVNDFDELLVLAPRVLDERHWPRFVARAQARVGKPYDFGFVAADNGQYYCSKLIYWAMAEVLRGPPMSLPLHWGGWGLMPNDLVENREAFEALLRLRLGDAAAQPEQLDAGIQTRAA